MAMIAQTTNAEYANYQKIIRVDTGYDNSDVGSYGKKLRVSKVWKSHNTQSQSKTNQCYNENTSLCK